MDEALADFVQLIADHPNESILHNNIADTYMQMERYEEAMQSVNRSLELDPRYVTAYVTKGEIFLKLEEDSKACEAFEEAIKRGFDRARLTELGADCPE
jgi:tetratricopeptide (TPR) repeat protein